MRRRRATDLKCLDAAALFDRRAPYGAFIQPKSSDVGRGVALLDAALVRGLREWRDLDYHGLEGLIVEQGNIAAHALPNLGREARRRLGR